jgi:hypothetical protein
MKNDINARVMKTTKIILGVALLTLGTFTFGQKSSLIEKVFHGRSNKVEYITAHHVTAPGKIEMKVQELLGMSNEFALLDEPVVYLSYTVARADVVYEEAINTEAWMTSPFEASLPEAGISVEPWMMSPFDSGLTENELSVERWMTTPFETDEDIKVESWMTTVWI